MKIFHFSACFLIAQNYAERSEDKLIRGLIPIKQKGRRNNFLELLETRKYSKFTHPVDLTGVTKIIDKTESAKIDDYCNSRIEFLNEALTESSENADKFGIDNAFEDENYRRAFFMVKISF